MENILPYLAVAIVIAALVVIFVQRKRGKNPIKPMPKNLPTAPFTPGAQMEDPCGLSVPGIGTPQSIWAAPPPVDQGMTNLCASYSWLQLLRAHPYPTSRFNQADVHEWHIEGTKRDNVQGEGSELHLTQVFAVGEYLKETGAIKDYFDLTTVEELENYLEYYGCAIFSGYFPDEASDTGEVTGGSFQHAALIHGYDRNVKFSDGAIGGFLVLNHFPTWGRNGHAWIKRDHMAALLANKKNRLTAAIKL